ncbi:hypothetical protein DXT63_08630 [Thermoanaerobacteraceae bacterium SP2]|nr:hypothetical protein DXT63_08630 [Thermoanaerobacteraceae bacterium SP2]
MGIGETVTIPRDEFLIILEAANNYIELAYEEYLNDIEHNCPELWEVFNKYKHLLPNPYIPY